MGRRFAVGERRFAEEDRFAVGLRPELPPPPPPSLFIAGEVWHSQQRVGEGVASVVSVKYGDPINDVGGVRVKIEVTEMPDGVAPRADGRGEAHIRVLTNEPVGPQVWPKLHELIPSVRPAFWDSYEGQFETFYPELTDPDEDGSYDGWGFEQWFVVAARRDY